VNSLVISLIKVPLGLVVAALAAFALARLRFRWQKLVLALIVMGTMVPIQVAIAPIFRIILSMGLLNSTAGLLLPYIAFGIPFQVFVLYGFFRAIPFELDEAAKIDGASTLGLFWKVILPLARPALGALFILDFVATWNEFSIAVAILHDQRAYTALQNFNSQYQSAYGQLNAAIVMSIIPVLIVFLLFQRYFVSGAFSGAVKG
jgi:raffinose/stachyose/melibiose transport system permease protein